MDTSLILQLVRDQLGITHTKRDEYIKKRIEASLTELTDDYGLEIDLQKNNHQMFVVDYVSWQIEDNSGAEKIPLFLSVRLKNLIIKKAGSRNVI